MNFESTNPTNLSGCRELRAVLALGIALAAMASMAFHGLRERTELLYEDLGTWRISSSGRELSDSFLGRLRPHGPQRPFRLVLAFEAPPEPGERIVAERSFVVGPEESFCFAVLVSNGQRTRGRKPSGSAPPTDPVRARVIVEERAVAEVVLADRRVGRSVRAEGIDPGSDGRIDVRFELDSVRARPGPRRGRSPQVRFEFARLAPCAMGRET